MLSLQHYLNDPCGAASIPYWKHKRIVVPENMKIVHERDIPNGVFHDCSDEPYFRLYHDLKNIKQMTTREVEIVSAKPSVNDPSNPESLYRRCGFTGNDIWHILTKK